MVPSTSRLMAIATRPERPTVASTAPIDPLFVLFPPPYMAPSLTHTFPCQFMFALSLPSAWEVPLAPSSLWLANISASHTPSRRPPPPPLRPQPGPGLLLCTPTHQCRTRARWSPASVLKGWRRWFKETSSTQLWPCVY